MSRRRRYAIVGTGSRAGMFVDAIAGPYRETADLVGLCDVSQARMDWHNRRLDAMAGVGRRARVPGRSLRPDGRRNEARHGHRHDGGRDPPPVHHEGHGARLRRDHREADDDRRGEDAGDLRRDRAHRAVAPRHLQLSLRSGLHGRAPPDDGGRGRAPAVRRLLVAPGHAARRGLLSALAPRAGELGRAPRAQGDPPLRPRELVDRLVPARGLRSGGARLLRPRECRGAGRVLPVRALHRATRRRGAIRSPCSSTGAPRCAGSTWRPRRRAATFATGTSSGSRSPSTTR